MTKIDISTGLPELPEGYFWRIEPFVNMFVETGKIVKVRMMRRRSWWFFKWNELMDDRAANNNLESILGAAEYVVQTTEIRASYIENYDRYLGDYPPKSLNA